MTYDKTIDICVKRDPIVPVRRSLPYQRIGRRKYEHPIYSWSFHEFWDQEIMVKRVII
jgi:hypothetical protein